MPVIPVAVVGTDVVAPPVKKDIARIYTVVRERELGIRTAPGSSDEDEK